MIPDPQTTCPCGKPFDTGPHTKDCVPNIRDCGLLFHQSDCKRGVPVAIAEKIVAQINNYSLEQTGKSKWAWKVECIADALREYGDECVKNAVMTMIHNEGIEIVRAQARTEALEEAAKVADKHKGCEYECGEVIFDEIRALAAKCKND